MQQNYGTSQETRLIPALLPDYARIDDREVPDLLAYISQYAERIPFFDLDETEPLGEGKNWGNFLQSNIAIILANIWNKNVQQIDEKRIELVNKILENEKAGDWLIDQLRRLLPSDPQRDNLIRASVGLLWEGRRDKWLLANIEACLGKGREKQWEQLFPKETHRSLTGLLIRILLFPDEEELVQLVREMQALWDEYIESVYVALIATLSVENLDLPALVDLTGNLPQWDEPAVLYRQIKKILDEKDPDSGVTIRKIRDVIGSGTDSFRSAIRGIVKPEKTRRYDDLVADLEEWSQSYETRRGLADRVKEMWKNHEKPEQIGAFVQSQAPTMRNRESFINSVREEMWKEEERILVKDRLLAMLRAGKKEALYRLLVKRLLQRHLGKAEDSSLIAAIRCLLLCPEKGEGKDAQESRKKLISVLEKMGHETAAEEKLSSFFQDEAGITQDPYPLVQALLQKVTSLNVTANKEQHFRELINLVFSIARDLAIWRDRLRASAAFGWDGPPEIEREIQFQIDKLQSDLRRLLDLGKPFFAEPYNRFFQEHRDICELLYGKSAVRKSDQPSEKEKEGCQGEDNGDPLPEITRIYRVFYNVMVQIKSIVPKYFSRVLTKKSDHSPPTGIVIAFAHLLKILQDQFNTLTTRHLNYYFEDILRMHPLPAKPDEIFVYLEPGTFSGTVSLPKGTALQGTKNEHGVAPVYRTLEDLEISQVQIEQLKTFYVSKNQHIDMGGAFELVSKIYAAPQADAPPGQAAPVSSGEWALFGEDQLDKPAAERTMEEAALGWAISSPVLLLQAGERRIRLRFQFVQASMENYRILMEDLCTRLPFGFPEVFHKTFHNSLRIQLSGADGWIEVDSYEVTPPVSITDNHMELSFLLEAFEPAVAPLPVELLPPGFPAEAPLVKITLEGKGPNYVYSFIRDLDIEKITIDVDVRGVRTMDLYNNLGQIDSSLPFQPFGPVPMRGSYLAIGYPEIFKKELTDLQFNIEWLNLPQDAHGFAGYYSSYRKEWDNLSFKVNLSALSNNQFYPPEDSPPLQFNLFENDPDQPGKVRSKTHMAGIDLERMEIKPDYALGPVLNFDNNTRSGFFKMELVSPPEAFGHEIYPVLFTEAVTENAKAPIWRLFGKSEPPGQPVSVPNEPYTPVARRMSLSYSATTTFNLALLEAEERDATAPEYVYHLHPFGYQQTYARGRILHTGWVPRLNEEGYLFIGLRNAEPPQTLSLYFELTEGSKDFSLREHPDIYWRYLSNDEWRAFPSEQVLADGTDNFSRSGIVRLQLPPDINPQNTVMPPGVYWICVVGKGDVDRIGKVRLLRPHAVRAVWEPDQEDPHHLQEPLPPFRVGALVEERPEVKAVFQPFPSFGGRPAESARDFYIRISERLMHKGRAVTHRELERLVLQAFPDIGQVRCLSHMLYPEEQEGLSVGRLVVVVVPKPDKYKMTMEPKVNIHLLNAIKSYLENRVSPFVQITVRNPAYEKIKVNCEIVFRDKTNSGLYIQQLNRELNYYLAPWLYGDATTLQLGGSLSKEAVINFIEQRPYVRFVTQFSIIQVIAKEEDYHLVRDTAYSAQPLSVIKAFSPWSVLIPFEQHQIRHVDEETYRPPQTSSIENISVGVDFIVRDEEAEKELYDQNDGMAIPPSQAPEVAPRVETFFRLSQDFDPKKVLREWDNDDE